MERKPFPSEMQERFIIRLPDGMRDQIANAAKANNRSMNAEIVARLQETFRTQYIATRAIAASGVTLPPDNLPEHLKGLAKEQAEELKKIFDRDFFPALRAVIDEKLDEERERRLRLTKQAIEEIEAEVLSKTKKPKG